MLAALRICGCILLAACSWLAVETALMMRETRATVAQLPAILTAESAATRAALVGEIAAGRKDIAVSLSHAGRAVSAQLDGLAVLIDSRAESIQLAAVSEIQATRAELLPARDELIAMIAEYRAIPAAVGERFEPWTTCRGNGNCWQAQVTATLGAARTTLGAAAKAAPAVSASAERSAIATEAATAATAKAMTNIAELSKPIPRWLRIPLQLLGPTMPIWGPFMWRKQ